MGFHAETFILKDRFNIDGCYEGVEADCAGVSAGERRTDDRGQMTAD